ncbi:E3 ubiquitin-protein ligase rnf8-like isoform X3 [Athalia rosae]|uniref:E3 ubiquitin-protein ligase rnf8-like isoform X3 n=1 Tax=Athalia rosae TaxID=37344 RepID=UPI00203332B3|nr:E3 ubiquitin-protein ligase rnf8-like isoform X3 [Athalia rosae]
MEDQENHNIKRNMSDRAEPVLMGVEKSDPSSYIHIDKNEFKIGRAKANDEIIAHVSISRQHCIFKQVGDKEWTIQNFSSGGTFVNQIALTSGERRILKPGDIIQFGPLAEFAYKFVFLSKNEPVAKKRRLSTPELELENIVMKQKTFEESQQMERDHLAEQMKAKHIEQLELKTELTKLLKDRETVLGEKDDLNKQINTLEKSIEDVKVAEINLEKLNRELSERLDKERQEFEARLNEEKRKMEEALEISKKEKEMLEKNMREQLEKLKEEQQIEHKKLTESLSEEKKAAEKLQGENTEFAQKLKEMENALVNMEAKANQLQTTLEERQALKAPEVVSLGTIAENVEILDDSNVMILETIDLTVETPSDKKVAETPSTGSVNEVFNKVGDIMDEQLTCSICSELFVTATTLECTHTFCQYCINTWKKKKAECPVCRASITAMHRSLVLDNFIDKMVENLSADYKKRRTDIVEERRENERLAKQATASGTGRRGRPRGRIANANVNATINLTGNAPAAATRSVVRPITLVPQAGQNGQTVYSIVGSRAETIQFGTIPRVRAVTLTRNPSISRVPRIINRAPHPAVVQAIQPARPTRVTVRPAVRLPTTTATQLHSTQAPPIVRPQRTRRTTSQTWIPQSTQRATAPTTIGE